MFRFPAKRPLKNPVKELDQDTQRLGILGMGSIVNVGLRQQGYHEIQEMKNIYVLLKHPVVQQRTRKLGK